VLEGRARLSPARRDRAKSLDFAALLGPVARWIIYRKVCHFREDFLCERKLSFSSSCSIFLQPIDYEDENEDDTGPLVPAEPAWDRRALP